MNHEQPKKRDFSRNNLDSALSPYLRQHKDNPVHWQMWSDDVLAYARERGKILFVSIGYSTCHWCHVMAADTFSDPECARLLNEKYISIKVDREERPDIDRFMMDFLLAATGSGGWPLNVFLSPDLKPFFAMTYASPEPRYGQAGFGEILRQVDSFYQNNKEKLKDFRPERKVSLFANQDQGPELVDKAISGSFDDVNGGFKGKQKFPPHSSLLYSLYRLSDKPADPVDPIKRGLDTFNLSTLEAMSLGGLHDHLQGGFFRYCVDQAWTIPHFEKMLYDQAMLLWVYALAYRIYGRELYRESARGILRFLQDSLYDEGLYCAGLDADTDHHEGATYIWREEELQKVLDPEEFSLLKSTFLLPRGGNFEGAIHLLRSDGDGTSGSAPFSPEMRRVCDKLLLHRANRPQPFRDRKKLTSWNALTGIALIQAYRYLGESSALEAALSLREKLLQLHYTAEGVVLRGSIGGELLGGNFLEDHAALLLYLTFCYEEDGAHKDIIEKLGDRLEEFRSKDGWTGSREADFVALPAQGDDLPIPSELAMAELALSRLSILSVQPHEEISFGTAGVEDFRNYGALHTGGYAWLVSSPEAVPWEQLPVHAVQIRSDQEQYCHQGTCNRGLPPV
jgi:uncharacterized protein